MSVIASLRDRLDLQGADHAVRASADDLVLSRPHDLVGASTVPVISKFVYQPTVDKRCACAGNDRTTEREKESRWPSGKNAQVLE